MGLNYDKTEPIVIINTPAPAVEYIRNYFSKRVYENKNIFTLIKKLYRYFNFFRFPFREGFRPLVYAPDTVTVNSRYLLSKRITVI